MLKFYYNPAYKYTNRTIIDVSSDTDYTSHDYENIDKAKTKLFEVMTKKELNHSSSILNLIHNIG